MAKLNLFMLKIGDAIIPDIFVLLFWKFYELITQILELTKSFAPSSNVATIKYLTSWVVASNVHDSIVTCKALTSLYWLIACLSVETRPVDKFVGGTWSTERRDKLLPLSCENCLAIGCTDGFSSILTDLAALKGGEESIF